jgi:predicted molibdopterin-dependent oxidoreductase YjgC
MTTSTPATPPNTAADILVAVNGVGVEFEQGGRVLGALRTAGFDVPTLCYESRLDPQGSCRMCMVEIEVNGRKKTVAACTSFQQEGMQVSTHSDDLNDYRRTMLELLLSETAPQAECPKCRQFETCEFHQAVDDYGAVAGEFKQVKPREKAPDPNPFIQRDYDFCIACYRCTNVCNDWEMASAITVEGRSQNVGITSFFNNELLSSPCTFCGQCINTCPTGALTDRKISPEADATKIERTRTICPYCGVGCGINLLTQDEQLMGVEPDFSAPSQGSLCVKGQFGSWDFVNNEERLRQPLIRKNGILTPASWEEAIRTVATRLKVVIESDGPDATVFWSSARCTNEANYLMQKFARVAVGTHNIDNCSRT